MTAEVDGEKRPKHKNNARGNDSGNGPAPKKAKATKRMRGKRGGKGRNKIYQL